MCFYCSELNKGEAMLKDVTESFTESLLEKVRKKSVCGLTKENAALNYKLTELSGSGG